MRAPHTFLSILLICLFYSSCKKDKETAKKLKPGAGEVYFQKGLNADSPDGMLAHFESGLNATDDRDTISLWLLDGKIYVLNKLKAYDSSLVYSDKLINSSQSQHNTYFEALGYYRKAVINQYLYKYEEKYENAYISRELFLSIGDSLRAGKRSLEMANAQSSMSDYTGSQENATTALRLLSKEKDSAHISSAFNVIAISYRERNFYDDAIAEYRNALRYSISIEDSLSFINNIALVYRDKRNYKGAFFNFERVLEKVEYADERSRARFIDNYAYTKWMQDSTAQVIDEFNTALNIRLKINDLDGLASSYKHLSNYYENRNINKALTYARQWRKTARKNSSSNSELNALKRIISLSPAKETKTYTNRFITLNDSLQDVKLKAKNAFAKINFDEQQKQREINNLEAAATRQKIETEQMENKMIILSLGGFLIFTIGGFIFYYFRQQHKREKIHEVYETETRISKRIHDELANDVYNVMSRMQNIAPPAMIDQIEHIYNRTRNISRENSSIPTGTNYLPHLLATLSSTIPENARLILNGEHTIKWNLLDPQKKIVLYRVLQEIMINMKKHSQAKLVAVIFSEEKSYLIINYSDNGIGSSIQNLKSGNGLQNVENRIFSVNGSLTFETEKGKGLKIRIRIPL